MTNSAEQRPNTPNFDKDDLRKRAQQRLKQLEQCEIDNLSTEEVRQLVVELQIHQVELELQNEELRNAHREIEKARDAYSSLYQHMPTGYLTANREGMIIQANQTLLEMLEVGREQVLRQPLAHFISVSNQHAFYGQWQEFFRSDSGYRMEIQMKKPGKDVFFARWEGLPVNDKSQGDQSCRIIISDISHEKSLERALRFHSKLLNQSMDIYLACTLNGHVSYANQACCELLDGSLTKLIDQPVQQVFPELIPHESNFHEILESMHRDNPWLNEKVLVHPTHGKQTYMFRASLLHDTNNQPNGIVIIGTDLTIRKKIECELSRSNERLELLHQLDMAILEAQKPSEIANAALSEIHHLIPYVAANVVMFDLKKETIRFLAVWDEQSGCAVDDSHPFPLNCFRLQEQFQHGESFLVQDMSSLDDLLPFEQDWFSRGIRSMIKVPLIYGDQLVGALNLGLKNRDGITEEYQAISRELAVTLALALYYADLFEQIESDSRTKSRLIEEVNHRVKNNLSAIIGLVYNLRNQSQNNPSINVAELMQDLEGRIRGLSTVHSLLAQTTWQPIDLTQLVQEMIVSNIKSCASRPLISFTVAPFGQKVSPVQANTIGLIVNELAMHTVRQAPSGDTRMEIVVSFEEQSDSMTGLIYTYQWKGSTPSHNGKIAYPPGGLDLIHSLVNDNLCGSFEQRDDRTIVIKFPMTPCQSQTESLLNS